MCCEAMAKATERALRAIAPDVDLIGSAEQHPRTGAASAEPAESLQGSTRKLRS